MFTTALFDCAINEKYCSVDGGRGICPLFCPHPGGFESSIVPTSRSLSSKAKKMLMPGGGISYAESPKPTQFLPRKQHAWRNGYLSADHYLSVYSLPFGFFTLGLKLPPSERQLSRQLRLIRSIEEQVPPHRSGIIL